jgi:hypothetical protein
MKMLGKIADLILDFELYGYSMQLELKEDKIFVVDKGIFLSSDDLFFVDVAYKDRKTEEVIFAINSPLFDVKGYLLLTKLEFQQLIEMGYGSKFKLTIIEFVGKPPGVEIKRQYNMRKISRNEFEADRFVLREGFPDFPPCPYGHTFKALGYDKQEKEYVRLNSSVLKKENIEVVKFIG